MSTFALIFVAELGDKTQFTVINMTAQHKKPLPVFVGAVLAFGVVTVIGAACGEGLTRVVPAEILRKVAAGLFVLMGVLIWFEVM